jgi:hypothetical protein
MQNLLQPNAPGLLMTVGAWLTAEVQAGRHRTTRVLTEHSPQPKFHKGAACR